MQTKQTALLGVLKMLTWGVRCVACREPCSSTSAYIEEGTSLSHWSQGNTGGTCMSIGTLCCLASDTKTVQHDGSMRKGEYMIEPFDDTAQHVCLRKQAGI